MVEISQEELRKQHEKERSIRKKIAILITIGIGILMIILTILSAIK